MKLRRSSHMKSLLCLFVFLGLSVTASSQSSRKERPAEKVPARSRIYKAKMEGGLDGFLAAEIMKLKLPLTVVTEDKHADFVLVGSLIKADDKWYHTVFRGKDKNEGNVQ